MKKLALALALFALPTTAIAAPRIDTSIAVDKRDGYCEWIVIDGEKPAQIGPADALYWRSFGGTFSGSLYYASGLDWGRYKWVRLPCVHPIYAALAGGAPSPVPAPVVKPDLTAELAAIRAALTAIEGKVR